jgi:hypothetical protein
MVNMVNYRCFKACNILLYMGQIVERHLHITISCRRHTSHELPKDALMTETEKAPNHTDLSKPRTFRFPSSMPAQKVILSCELNTDSLMQSKQVFVRLSGRFCLCYRGSKVYWGINWSKFIKYLAQIPFYFVQVVQSNSYVWPAFRCIKSLMIIVGFPASGWWAWTKHTCM